MGFTFHLIMVLQDEIKQILIDFDNALPEKILEILTQIQPYLKSEITQKYLEGKIHDIMILTDIVEKKKLCKNLKPYLDWYLQGI